MDTSKTYIKMCNCEEIQKAWQGLLKTQANHLLSWADSGDFVYCKSNNKIVVLYFNKYHGSPPEKYLSPYTAIWLPRQDQLQEMVKGTKHMHLLAYEFAAYFHGTIDPLYQNIGRDNYTVDSDGSMEQMWLAFVMKEKYNKVWDGSEWIKR